MNKNDMKIRLERKEERREVETLVRESFWNVYRPGCLEHYVLHEMRNHPNFIPELNYVLEKGGRIIGQNVFVHAVIKADDGRAIPIAAMGPICIASEFKRQGYGKILLDYTLAKAEEYGIKALCFEGNIDFYGKSGFDYASKFNIPIMVCRKGRMLPSSSARSWRKGTSMALPASTHPRNVILQMKAKRRYLIKPFRRRKK